jgi:hypothetical protein
MEYDETHTWPWEDDGWVWPWQAVLWGNTIYGDGEEFGESVTAYFHRPDINAEDGNAIAEPFAGDDPIIPPTPFLPGGLRPVQLERPQHHSGLLGESPAPIKFKHFSGDGRRFMGLREGITEEEEGH